MAGRGDNVESFGNITELVETHPADYNYPNFIRTSENNDAVGIPNHNLNLNIAPNEDENGGKIERNLEFIIERRIEKRPTEKKETKRPSMSEKYSPPLKFERKLQKRNIIKKTPSKRRKKRNNQYRNLQSGETEGELYCRVCGVTESPQWRKGPDGQISLCNACGLHYLANLQKEKKINPNLNPAPIPISSVLN